MSDKKKQVLAFDFGGGSGRAILGTLENGKIHMEEVHRFSNDPVIVNGTMYWDTLRHFFEIKQGIVKAKQKGGFESIGIDTWGVISDYWTSMAICLRVPYIIEMTELLECRKKFLKSFQRRKSTI